MGNPQMAMQMGVLNDPKIKKVFEKLMGMSFPSGTDDDNKQNAEDVPMKDANPFSNASSNDDTKKKEDEKKKEPTPPPPEPELSEEEKKRIEEERKIQSQALQHKEAGNALYKEQKYKEAKDAYQKGLKIDANNSTLKDGLAECEKAMNKPQGSGLFGPQIWQTISLDPELRPFMNDQDFVQKVNMLNANPQMAMQMGVLNDPKIKKVFEKLMGMSFPSGTDDDNKQNADGDIPMSDANPFSNTTKSKEPEKKQKEPTPPPP